MSLRIESDVPLPTKRRAQTRFGNEIETWQVGQSVVFQSPADFETFRSLALRRGQRVATRKSSEGWRVWRVA